MGIQTDLDCFYHSDIELKAANLLYQLTPEEVDEFHKCSEDIIYFVEKYCRFLTDSGRKTVPLRPYQKKILLNLSKEYLNQDYDIVPENRNAIIMASRQTGKCLFSSDIIILYPNNNVYHVPISIFYYLVLSTKRKLTLLEKIKVKLIMLYITNNDGKTADQTMIDSGYIKIYNTGNLKWVYERPN
jgi:hypothetical protein